LKFELILRIYELHKSFFMSKNSFSCGFKPLKLINAAS
jgi:hypothetical protein